MKQSWFLQIPDLLTPSNNPVNSASASKVGPRDGLYFILSRHPWAGGRRDLDTRQQRSQTFVAAGKADINPGRPGGRAATLHYFVTESEL